MSVYVDEVRRWANAPKIRGQDRLWCHLSADTDAELESFTRVLGLREAWGQCGHYDITGGKRRLAVKAGAVQITAREMVSVRQRLVSP